MLHKFINEVRKKPHLRNKRTTIGDTKTHILCKMIAGVLGGMCLAGVVTQPLQAAVQQTSAVMEQRMFLALEDQELQTLFQLITEETGVPVVFSSNILPDIRVNLQGQWRTVREVLDEALQGTYLRYENQDGGIVIYRSHHLSAPPKKIEIKGYITDMEGQPMPGVNVLEKGSPGHGTVSDADGHYAFTVDARGILIFSYIGFKTQEVFMRGRVSPLSIQLEEDVKDLEPVEVLLNTGYYPVHEREATGNIFTITEATLARQPATYLWEAMQGRVPGVQITPGTPGSGRKNLVRIRGQNSLRTPETHRVDGNDPLIIVDGVPMPAYNSSENGVVLDHAFNFLNIQDIDTVIFLKDADVTAIYGSRGANGVILVTTKRGGHKDLQVNFSLASGIQAMERTMALLNTKQFVALRREAFTNDQIILPPDLQDTFIGDTTRNINWQKRLLGGPGHIHTVGVSVFGGRNQFSMRGSANYLNQRSVLPKPYYFRQANVLLNLDYHSEDDKFQLLLSQYHVVNQTNQPLNELLMEALRMAPNREYISKDGTLLWDNLNELQHPLAFFKTPFQANGYDVVVGINGTYRPWRNLEVSTRLGLMKLQAREILKIPIEAQNPLNSEPLENKAWFERDKLFSLFFEQKAQYHTRWAGGVVNAVAGVTANADRRTGEAIQGLRFLNTALMDSPYGADSVVLAGFSNRRYIYQAAFARLNYTWHRKYILNLTGRGDGSSRFPPQNQYACFGAVGLAWIFTREPFLQNYMPWLSFGKFRASYGATGNDQIDDYAYLDEYKEGRYTYQGKTLKPLRLANLDYTWEISRKFEAALDLGFWNDQVRLSVSYYRNRSTNLLSGKSLSTQTGFSEIQANVPAVIENKGWEVVLNSLKTGPAWSWQSQFTVTFPQSKLVAYPDVDQSVYAGKYFVGRSLTVQKGHLFDSVDPNTGRYRFQDLDHNGVIDDDDKAFLKSGLFFFGGWNHLITYRRLSVSAFVQFVHRTAFEDYNFEKTGAAQNQPTKAWHRWQHTGDKTNVAAASSEFVNVTTQEHLRWVWSDANYNTHTSFLRLKSVSLIYEPIRDHEHPVIHGLRLYVQGQNLWTATRYLGLNPEGTLIQSLRTVTAGLQLTF